MPDVWSILAALMAAAGGFLTLAGGWSALWGREVYVRLQGAGVAQWGASLLLCALAVAAAHPARSAVLVLLSVLTAAIGAALRQALADAARAAGIEPYLTPDARP